MNKPYRRPAALVAVALTLIFGIVLGGFTQSGYAQDDPDPIATVRFAHVYSGGGPIDIYIDDALAVEQLAFGTATEYAVVPTGDREVAIVATGADISDALVTSTLTMDEGNVYNVLIGGQEEQLDARVFEVNQDDLDSGEARIRFIQGEPGAGPVNIALTAPGVDPTDVEEGDASSDFPSFENVGLDTGNDYLSVDAGVYGMVVSNPDDDQQMINLPDIDMSAGNVYDIVVLGQLQTNNLTFLPLITSLSPGCSEVLGLGQGSDSCVRFAHVSPDAGSVDVYVDGQLAATDLTYGNVTEFASVPGGDHQVQVTGTGQSPDDAVLNADVSLNSGEATQYVVIGMAAQDDNDDNDLQIVQSNVDISPLAPAQSRLRAIHAVAGGPNVAVTMRDGAELFGDVGFGDISDYVMIEAENIGLVVTDEENNILVDAPDIALESGMTYDALVIGDASDPSTLQILLLSAPSAVLEGFQGTPLAVGDVGETPIASPVGSAEVTPLGGGGESDMTPTTIPAGEVTPVLTVEPTATP